ncbi:hypothetical protein SK128_001786 [Halocaridina rubra]|uniref:Uncharacterized protein n=1 Tax=Halocaridina rubra TaxID=373956 RepID=A0AAN9A6M3_HALRR
MDGEMKENETLREQIRSLEEANKAQGQERKELEKRIKKLEGEKSQLESRISNQEDKNKQLNDNLKELDREQDASQPSSMRKLSVLILGNDAISRGNMIRNMPKTRAYLLDELEAIEMNAYNKLGDNTFQNLLRVSLYSVSSGHQIYHTQGREQLQRLISLI